MRFLLVMVLAALPLDALAQGEGGPPSRLDGLLERQEANARRALASICVGCDLAGAVEGPAFETEVPVLPVLGDDPAS